MRILIGCGREDFKGLRDQARGEVGREKSVVGNNIGVGHVMEEFVGTW